MNLYTQEQIEKELQTTFKDGHYNARTTFGMDFAIANRFGKAAIIDTWNRSFNAWKNDIIYLTELSMVMNAYCWEYYEKDNNELAELYQDYYYQCYDYVYNDSEKHFNKAEIGYYFQCTD